MNSFREAGRLHVQAIRCSKGTVRTFNQEQAMKNVIYDGKKFCHTNDCCPVATLDEATRMVTLQDSQKPEQGSFRMTIPEWNTLLKNASPIED